MTTESYKTTTEDLFGLDMTPGGEGLPDDVLLGRAKFLKEAIEHMIRRLAGRRRIRNGNLLRIDTEQARTQTRIMQLPRIMPGSNRDIDRLLEQMEVELQRLELERSKEEAASWKDIATLQSDLIELVREYRTLIDKIEVLMGRPYPHPTIPELLWPVERDDEDASPLGADEPPTPLELDHLRRIP